MNDDNVVEFTGEWQGDENAPELSDAEYDAAMEEILERVDYDQLNATVTGVLEYLTIRAVMDCGYYIMTDNKDAVAVFAANDDVKALMEALPKHFKCLNDEIMDEDFITNSDPGDEQNEPTA